MGSSSLATEFFLRMARLMPLLLAAASAKELQGVKHVLAGSEYSVSAAAQRDERALVFGDDVPADKFRSCKKHGSDPRSLNDFTTEDIEKMKNFLFLTPSTPTRCCLWSTSPLSEATPRSTTL